MTWALILSDEDGERWNGPLSVAEVFQITCRASLVHLDDAVCDMRQERDEGRVEVEHLYETLRNVRDFNAVPRPGYKKEYGACDPTPLLLEREPWLFYWSHTCEAYVVERDGRQEVEQFKCWLSRGERCPRCDKSQPPDEVVIREHQR